ncbi:MAG: D-alanyl-D-alanine carboxypeptidase [Lachnospiraceae bacterium]|nr:D-alanyl-D-alanine carboxypeptidase [Lachnospiraceae bacterium]
MKIKRIIATMLTCVMVITGTSATIFALPQSATKTHAASTWPSGPKKSKLSSQSAIVMELSTGTILYEKDIHKKRYPASITKIMTSLLTAENTSLSETVTVSQSAAYGIERGSSTVFSDPGEKLTVEQCLYGIMLESANELCLAVGEHISGSTEDFVKLMNQRVKELGLKDTHFSNPNGLPDPNHYTSAHDMAVIARQAMKYSAFRKVCNTKTYICDKTNTHKTTRIWSNHHQMVNGWRYPKYEYKYAIGGKTGYTHVAKNTLVTYAEKDGMELVCVIMKAEGPQQGTPNEYTDSTTLLNFGFEKYQKYTIDAENAEINTDLFNNYGSYFNTKESPIHLSDDSTVVLPKGVSLSAAKQTIQYNDGIQMQEGDNIIGKITYTYENRTVGSSDIIYTMSDKTSHLDDASRTLVSSKIQDLETKTAKHKKQKLIFSRIGKSVNSFFRKAGNLFHNQLVGSTVIISVALLLIIVITLILRSLTPSGRNRRRRKRSGGYQSKGGRKHHAKQKRQNNGSGFSTGSARRNHSKHYEKVKPQKKAEKNRKKGLQYHKRHKNTTESFGKNFFDY